MYSQTEADSKLGLRFLLNNRVIDDGETPSQDVINTERIGGLVFKKIETDHSQDQDIQNLIRARNMGDAADAKLQAQNAAMNAMMTNIQPTDTIMSRQEGNWAVMTNTNK